MSNQGNTRGNKDYGQETPHGNANSDDAEQHTENRFPEKKEKPRNFYKKAKDSVKDTLPFNHSSTRLEVEISLEEVLCGTKKKLEIPKTILDFFRVLFKVKKDIFVKIPPGCENGQKIEFPKESHETFSKTPADIVVFVKVKDHPKFIRVGNDIYYRAEITNHDWNQNLRVPTLEKEYLPVKDLGHFHGDSQLMNRPFEGRGLPDPKEPTKRGDLFAIFKVVRVRHQQCQPVEKIIKFSLENLLKGCKSSIELKKTIYHSDGVEISENKWVKLDIEPGCPRGRRIIFEREGDQFPGIIPADVVFVIEDEPHEHFTRSKSDILHTAKIENSGSLFIPVLDGETIHLPDAESIENESVQCFQGRGLPYPDEPSKRGDLIVTFENLNSSRKFEFEEQKKKKLIQDEPSKERLLYLEKFGSPKRLEFKIHNQSILDQEVPPVQDEPIKHDIFVRLEDLLNGTTKKMKITKHIYDVEGNYTEHEKVLFVEIKPGTKEGTEIVFEQEGDQHPFRTPANVIFVVKYTPHKFFILIGRDLLYTIKTDWPSTFEQFTVPSLENEKLLVENNENIHDGFVHTFYGRGLPDPEEPNKRGDLIVKFELKELLRKQDPPIEKSLPITLEEVFSGTNKQEKFLAKTFDEHGNVAEEEIKIFSIDIKAGCESGTRFCFPQEGDKYPSRIPADIVYNVKYEDHPLFTPEGRNIHYTAKITHEKWNEDLKIPTLDGEEVAVEKVETITSGSQLIYNNRGLPFSEHNKRGDLIVHFEIPKPQTQRKILANQETSLLANENSYRLKESVEMQEIESSDENSYRLKESVEMQEIESSDENSYTYEESVKMQEIEVSLEEILHGTTKMVKHVETTYDSNKKEKSNSKEFPIYIKPGTKNGTKITWKDENDSNYEEDEEDKVYFIKEKPHPRFKRIGNDLFLKQTIKPKDFKKKLTIKTLENEELSVINPETLAQDPRRIFYGHGLPSIEGGLQGDLIVDFEIK